MEPTCEGSVGPRIEVPDVGFVWVRFANMYRRGQLSEGMLLRKEVERVGNGGLFGWGSGTSIVPSLQVLLEKTDTPRMLFSKTLVQDGDDDDQPGGITVWRGGKDVMEGHHRVVQLPRFFTVTGPPGGRFYAMILSSVTPLVPFADDGPVLYRSELRNVRTGGQVQAQNPLAVVRRIGERVPGDTGYPVLFAATLVYPYFVEMTDPISG